MGLLDTVKLPEGAKKKTSVLDGVKVPVNRGAAFEMQSLQQRQTTMQAEGISFQPLKSFAEGWKSHKGSDRSFKSAFLEGAPVKVGGQVVSDTLEDQTERMGSAFRPAIEGYLNGDMKKADVVAGLGNYVMGIVNMGFSPVSGALKGAESIPVLGLVATGLNKFAAGLAGTGANAAVSFIDSLPEGVMDQETTDKLTPLANEVGSLVGMLLGFKAAGKGLGKVGESRFVKPRIEALDAKLKEMGELIKNDPKLSTEVARFVAEQGPVRNVPITSETPNSRQIPVTPNQKQAVYAKKMGYEPYQDPRTLPVIDMGDGKTTPRTDTSGLPVIEAGEGKTPIQESLPTPAEKKSDITIEPIKEPAFASPEYNQLLVQLELAEAGRRNFIPQEGTMDYQVTAQRSSFPEWMPEGTRRRSIIDKYLKDRQGTVDDINLKYKEGSNLDKLDKAVRAQEEKMQRAKELPPQAGTVTGPDGTTRFVTLEDVAQSTDGGMRMGPDGLPRPVEGTGATKTSRLSERAEALQKEFETVVDGLPQYNKAEGTYQGMKMADLAERVDVMSTEQLRSMVRNPETIPADIPGAFIWKALSERNKELADPMITAELFRSEISGFVTRSAQEMRALVGIDKGSPESIITDLIKEREASFQEKTKTDVTKVKEEAVSQIREFIMKEKISVKDVEAFIKEITCK
jgi:hypothetical protein